MSADEVAAVKAKVAAIFPKASAIPEAADVKHVDQALYLMNGKVLEWKGKVENILSPVYVQDEKGDAKPRVLGKVPSLSKEEALKLLDSAVDAYNVGAGAWPTASVETRVAAVEKFVKLMEKQREPVVRMLMWEIGKTRADSEKEFDRTVEYIYATIDAVKEADRNAGRFQIQAGVVAQIRRSPLGVTLCMGPFNYPLNETFATLIPALIMGNPVIAKLARFGQLCMYPLLEAFATSFPAGVISIYSGSGRETASPLMSSGKIASLAFIGTPEAANVLKKLHPTPTRLRCTLGLGAKNVGIILNDADIDNAVKQCVTGTLTFNGQRCTAIKVVFVQSGIADKFVEKFSQAVDKLGIGMPWEKGVAITPLPEPGKAKVLNDYVQDAVGKGAKVVNKFGGITNGSFYFPSVVYPVSAESKLWKEEQFGPVVPIAKFDDVKEVLDYMIKSDFGQQCSLFGRDPKVLGPLIDVLVNQVSRVNLNAQCQRGPDSYPFTGRKDSAEGTLSITDALRCFSIRTMVAANLSDDNKQIIAGVLNNHHSNFLNTNFIF